MPKIVLEYTEERRFVLEVINQSQHHREVSCSLDTVASCTRVDYASDIFAYEVILDTGHRVFESPGIYMLLSYSFILSNWSQMSSHK